MALHFCLLEEVSAFLPSYHADIEIARLWAGDLSCLLMACLCVCVCVCGVHKGVFVCLGTCGSCTYVIVLVHLTVLATAIRSVSGLQFQKEIEVGKEGRKRCKPMKLIC